MRTQKRTPHNQPTNPQKQTHQPAMHNQPASLPASQTNPKRASQNKHQPQTNNQTFDHRPAINAHTNHKKGQCKHTHQHPTTHMCGQQVASEMSVTITLDTLLDFQPPHPHPTHNQQGCPQGGADQNSTTPTNQPQPHNRSHNQSEEQTKPNPCHTRTPTTSFF